MERLAYSAYLRGFSRIFFEGVQMEECLGYAIGTHAATMGEPLLSFAAFKNCLTTYLKDNQ